MLKRWLRAWGDETGDLASFAIMVSTAIYVGVVIGLLVKRYVLI